MNERMSPIPSRLYNAAVGGHVAGADQIIDDETGLTLDKVAGGALEEKEYTSGSDNGMGRVVLRKNLVNGVNTLTQNMINNSNTVYVIQYDFVLGENITIPANCVLEFDGGSISGEHTIIGNNTIIKAGCCKIFGDINIRYNTFIPYNGVVYVDWFDSADLGVALSAAQYFKGNNSVIKLSPKTYTLETPAKIVGGANIDLNNATIFVNTNEPAFVDINYGVNTDYACGNIKIYNGTIIPNTERNNNYIIDIKNASYLTLDSIIIENRNNLALNELFGVRIGKKTSGYHGTVFVNTILNCTLPHINIEVEATDGYMSNNKIWASNINSGAIRLNASSWQIIGNQIVGGKKGGIYIPTNAKPTILKIEGNYFDGSYYNIDTQNGINVDDTNFNTTYISNSIISGNTFWHQKGIGVYGRILNSVIADNLFDDCDYWNNALPDIDLNNSPNNVIIGNTFVRAQYKDQNGNTYTRKNADSDDFTRPAIIKVLGRNWQSLNSIQGNVCSSPDYYNPAQYLTNSSAYKDFVKVRNNSKLFCNDGDYGTTSERPSEARDGFVYFDISLTPPRPIWKYNGGWVDATGATV